MPDDRELWERISRGDAFALDVLYRMHAPKLELFLRQILRSRQAAEDVMQETFAQIWKNPNVRRASRDFGDTRGNRSLTSLYGTRSAEKPMARCAERKKGARMKCEEGAEFVSALCDGERIPQEAAKHIDECEVCRERLNAYSTMGTELRRVASLQEQTEVKAGSWEKVPRTQPTWCQKARTTMRIPRFAFASMLGMILLLSGGLVLVRARTAVAGPVFVLTYKIPADGRVGHCMMVTGGNRGINSCTEGIGGLWGFLTMKIRYVGKEGERIALGVKTRYEAQARPLEMSNIDPLDDIPEQTVWIEPGSKQQISVPGLGEIELTGEYLDHIPTLLYRPNEALDPKRDEFRIVSPVLIRGNEVVFNLAGSNSTDSGDPDAALMIYFPGEGRYLISTVPFAGAVEGKVDVGQIKFSLEGQDYLLLTATPTTRSEHVWVTHDPQYKLSEHMQGAHDDQSMFMVRSLSKLLQKQIRHL